MYNSYFGFTEFPFENKLDQKFLYLGEDHGEVLAALLYFIKENKGFAVVSGDVGTGKTMVINSLLDRLPNSIYPITISNPKVTYDVLLRYIGKELHLNNINDNILELTDDIKSALLVERNQGKYYILIVDEAHLLHDESLEDIRLLSNIETQDQKLLQILLVGQYELSHKLDRPEMRQLRQRINISRFLSPLGPHETIQYINYRLNKVGSDFDACFEPNCKVLIFKMTEGVPRKINQICDSALLICMTEKRRKINQAILKKAREALLTDQIFTPRSFAQKHLGWQKLQKAIIFGVLAGFLVLGGVFAQKLVGRSFYSMAKSPLSPQETAPTGANTPYPTSRNHNHSPASPVAPPMSQVAQKSPKLSASSAPQEPQTVVNPPMVRLEPIGTPPSQELPGGMTPDNGPAKPGLPEFQATLVARQVIIKPGDSLLGIASQYYPKNLDLCLEAIILANLNNSGIDLIHPGQVLFLPEINFNDNIIKLRDNLYYAPLTHFRSFNNLEKAMAKLSQHRIRYLVINSFDNTGATTHRVIVGGYEKSDELKRAMKKVNGTF
jgi:type II secretory pathway predicted ATPase ExeA